MTNTQHTPAPWEVAEWHGSRKTLAPAGMGGKHGFMEANTEANARRIVQCVNAHDELVAALQAAEVALAEGDENCGGEDDNIYHQPLLDVRAALAKAGVQP